MLYLFLFYYADQQKDIQCSEDQQDYFSSCCFSIYSRLQYL